MRTLRFRSAATAATTALVAALALTACQSSDTVSADPKPRATPKTATDEPASTASDKPQTSTDRAGSSSTASSIGANNRKGSVTCHGGNTNVTVTKVTRPINYLLVTATNTGDRNCHAYYAPFLRFDEAQSATQINEDSRPQAVVTLAPGESAYASIAQGGDGNPDIAAAELTVSFAGRDNQGSVGAASAPLALPKGTMIAASTSVSFWQSTMADALAW